MLPEDLRIIYGSLKPLSESNGFVQNAKPFIFQEVIDMGNEAVRRQEYRSLGTVTEFTYSTQVNCHVIMMNCFKIILRYNWRRLVWSFVKLIAISTL
jgi:hypothetical protein